MLRYYLRERRLALSWVGTGRLIFSLNYSDEEMAEVPAPLRRRLLPQADGWWWSSPDLTHRSISARPVAREMLRQRLGMA